MTKLKVLRVFANQSGNYGNPVGILADTDHKYNVAERQRISAASGFSETVFINDIKTRSITIFNPQGEVSFAGHAVVGVVAFLTQELGQEVNSISGSDGKIMAWTEDSLTWVKAELRTTPPWWHEKLANKEEIDKLTGPQSSNQDHVQVWAWIDESKGTVRSRTFAPAWGIPEDEANGSGCMRLAATLGRSLIIYHGLGSVILARPSDPGYAEVGGLVAPADDLIIR
ncbi:MAG: PhzF family phenazine biosynthesis protein [Chloroflexi bacterium]|nr:PhzF family phenazine biosynthesis protein [Chloroflexota bacterium]